MIAPAIFFLFKMALAIQGLCDSTQILEYIFFLFCDKLQLSLIEGNIRYLFALF